jgi:putative DNA primase/helicase
MRENQPPAPRDPWELEPEDEPAGSMPARGLESNSIAFALTDLGNAQRLAHRHGRKLRYCTPIRAWLIWDGSRWRRDDVQRIMTYAAETAKSIYGEAAAAGDLETRKEIAQHAYSSESAYKLAAMIHLAEAHPNLAIRPDQLDTNEMLLNVANGTLDLRTGDLRPALEGDLITKVAPVDYDPDRTSELWDRFLREVTGGDEELADYLQRAVGYSLTGRTTEHAVFFVYGPPATGKSKFTGAIKDVLGDYAMQTAFETFLAKRWGGGASNDIADLAGARLVLATEADRGRRFAEATLKQLTGGDTVRARQLYEKNFEFRPQFKLWLAANDAPQVNNDDDAIFRRMNIVPFVHVVPLERRDKDLGERLARPEVRSAILAWAVRGCLVWQQEGLNAPELVSEATKQYRDDQDPLQFFLDEHCVLEPDRMIVKAKLQQHYVTWAKGAGVRYLLSPREFTKRVAKIPGVQDSRGSGGVRIWRGIDVRENWEGSSSGSAPGRKE